MSNRTIISLLVFCSFFSNCTHRKEINESSFSVKMDVNPTQSAKKELTGILKNIQYIQLETTEDCLLKFIHKVQIHQNKIFVFSSDNSGKLFCFDSNGKFLFKVGNRGNGPGEYVYMTSFHIDSHRDCIWVGDDARKIIKYDLSGKFLAEYTTEFSIKNLLPISDNEEIMAIRLGYYKNKNYSFILYDIAEKRIIFSKELSNDVERMVAGNSFFEYQGSILYTGMFNDTIFRLDKERLTPHAVVDFGRYSFSNESLSDKNHKIAISEFLNPNKKYAGLIRSIYEDAGFISFCYDFSGGGRIAVYSKDKKEVSNIKEITIGEKSFDAARFFLNNRHKDQLISFLPAHLLTEEESIKSCFRKEYGRYSDISDVISNLTADDNPVLIFGNENFKSLFPDRR